VGATLEGDRSLIRALDRLGNAGIKRVVRKAVNAAIQPILKAARENVPRDEGDLKKSLTKQVRVFKSGTIVGYVGLRRGAEDPESGDLLAVRASVVEFGSLRPGGKIIMPRPWLAPALFSNTAEVMSKLNAKIRQGLSAESRRKK